MPTRQEIAEMEMRQCTNSTQACLYLTCMMCSFQHQYHSLVFKNIHGFLHLFTHDGNRFNESQTHPSRFVSSPSKRASMAAAADGTCCKWLNTFCHAAVDEPPAPVAAPPAVTAPADGMLLLLLPA